MIIWSFGWLLFLLHYVAFSNIRHWIFLWRWLLALHLVGSFGFQTWMTLLWQVGRSGCYRELNKQECYLANKRRRSCTIGSFICFCPSFHFMFSAFPFLSFFFNLVCSPTPFLYTLQYLLLYLESSSVSLINRTSSCRTLLKTYFS